MQPNRRHPLTALLLAVGILALGAAAPAAQASEVVKLARLVITGKWSSSPSTGSAEPPSKAPAPEKQPAPEPSAEPAHGPTSQFTGPGAGPQVLAAHRVRTVL